ncbi:Dyp-type peroxidase [Paenibacillus barcinonensis]|uniref:Dyp-type peroxidase n=1 Tax=Paenibacillus barcinonensis TaxID=198119 RepID=UPI001C118608|nr:Dyp-type peroxidase [Paenibacillus barcinonensis]MBU5351954.1 Dyp-type peroxidase [Paenibacillus barcinonensis]
MAGGLEEPLLDINEIQGNSVPGFNKDYQTFLFFDIVEPVLAKRWLSNWIPYVSTAQEVLQFNRLYQLMRERRGEEPDGIMATWLNIAFSYEGLKQLTDDLGVFEDSEFKLGMKKRSGILGDPTGTSHEQQEGHVKNWLFGGERNPVHLVLIAAGDDHVKLKKWTELIKESTRQLPGADPGTGGGIRLVFEQEGQARQDLKGHEHFGFKDGISQPGVRGRVSVMAEDYLTRRIIDPSDPHATLYAKPGQPLIWPGQFVFGYPQQLRDDSLHPKQSDLQMTGWVSNGSYLVIRRLRQDVVAFWEFVRMEAQKLGLKPEKFAALMFGRWPSGAPILLAPEEDDTLLGHNELANNHFMYVEDSQTIKLRPEFAESQKQVHQVKGDPQAARCPFAAHIRKTNPRDETTDTGSLSDSLVRRILRRGIPFGEPLPVNFETGLTGSDQYGGNRGLMFVAYMTSIEKQFEFISRNWMNSKCEPKEGGHDPITGQHDRDARKREFELMDRTLVLDKEWVIPTGGEYFFQPSISALRNVLAK